MADTAKRVYGPAAPATTAATAYTVPASTTFILKQIHASNGTASSATVTASVGTDAAGTRIIDALTVPANGTYTLDTWIPLAATEIIQVKQGTASACTLTITGVEVT